MNPLRFLIALTLVSLLHAKPAVYDPLAVGEKEVSSVTFDVADKSRDRVIPIRAYLPEAEKAAPVILFSHGLGGSRDNNPYLGNHWAKRGYVVVFVQHPGSDESVWKEVPRMQRMAEMKKAASAESFLDRVKDIPAVLDALGKWNGEKTHALVGRLDLEHVGMSGHSFGAVTSQAMAGQGYAGGRVSYLEERIDAALMMSPSTPKLGDPAMAFGTISMPCMLMTGTLDASPISDATPESRLMVFPNLTAAPAWQVVFDKATHMSFGDRDLAGKDLKGSRYHESILALGTAFWDAHLKNDKAAMEWLNGDGARKALISEDRWERNAKAN